MASAPRSSASHLHKILIMTMKTQLIIRIDAELKNKVSKLAASEGKSLSEVTRNLLLRYVKERDVRGYIMGLWDDMGAEVAARGLSADDIDAIIREVREEGAESRS